jgi:hypothetical protein
METGIRLTIIASDQTWVFARWRNLLLVDWRAKPSLERVKQVGHQLRAIAAERDRPQIHIMTIVERAASGPDAESRDAMQKDLRALGSQIGSLAALVLVEGFIGAAVRALLAGMNMILRERYPVGVLSNEVAAATWIAGKMSDVSVADITAAIERTRSA